MENLPKCRYDRKCILIADLLLKHSNEIPQELSEPIWKLIEDPLVCLGAANSELVQRRREAL